MKDRQMVVQPVRRFLRISAPMPIPNPCRTQADIMPDAWAEYLKDKDTNDRSRFLRLQECKAYPLTAHGRDTANAAVVEVVANRTGDDRDDPFQVLSVRLVERLKATKFWALGTTRNINVTESTIGAPGETPKDLALGERYMMLFEHPAWNEPNGVWLDQCGVLPVTENNLNQIRRGIDEDFLSLRTDQK